MPNAGIAPSISGNEIRLVVSGGWSEQAAAEVLRARFDRIEFHGGEYANFKFLEPYKDKLSSMSIMSGTWSSADGLEDLTSLRSLVLGVSLKGVDFSVLPRLESLSLGAWMAGYAKKLFECSKLKSLHIEGFTEGDCDGLGRLKSLESLSLARGKLETLSGLAHCTRLRALQFSHLRKLAALSEISSMHSIREVELVESLPLIRDVAAITACEQLQRLDLRGVDIAFDDVSWLKRMHQLNVLGLGNIRSPDWDAIFASRQLKKIAVSFAKAPGITIDEVRAAAISHELVPTEVKPLGLPAKPLGFVIEFRPEGSRQNLWFWRNPEE